VNEFRLSSAAEEASRFLYYACQGSASNRTVFDRESFYSEAIEHALAYLGAQILCGGREEVSEEKSALKPSGSEFAGYMLGSQLYDSYIAGRMSSRHLRQLFLTKPSAPGSAKALFRELSRKKGKSPKS
jgi:hypothetical protein